MKNSNGAFLLLMLIAMATGCKNKNEAERSVSSLLAGENLFCDCTNGSYWIYNNGIKSDSAFVKTYEHEMNLSSNTKTVTIRIGSQLIDGEIDAFVKTDMNVNKTLLFATYNYPYGFQYEIAIKGNGMMDSNGISPYAFIDTLLNYVITGYKFPIAYRIQNNRFDSAKYIVVVPDIGVVEKKLKNQDDAFKLIRYNIVRL